MPIQKGDFIRLSFTGRLTDGTVFDTTDEKIAKESGIYDEEKKYSPMVVIVGSGFLVEGLEEDLIGKKAGYSGKVKIEPGERLRRPQPRRHRDRAGQEVRGQGRTRGNGRV